MHFTAQIDCPPGHSDAPDITGVHPVLMIYSDDALVLNLHCMISLIYSYSLSDLPAIIINLYIDPGLDIVVFM